jgi:hypothetical protein
MAIWTVGGKLEGLADELERDSVRREWVWFAVLLESETAMTLAITWLELSAADSARCGEADGGRESGATEIAIALILNAASACVRHPIQMHRPSWLVVPRPHPAQIAQ